MINGPQTIPEGNLTDPSRLRRIAENLRAETIPHKTEEIAADALDRAADRIAELETRLRIFTRTRHT